MNMMDLWEQWEVARLAGALVAGVALAALLSCWYRLQRLHRLVETDVMNRLAPLLTVSPAQSAAAAGQGTLDILVKNHGAGPAGDLLAEVWWGEQRWALPLPAGLAGHSDQLLQLVPVLPGRRRKDPALQVRLQFTTVTGIVVTKRLWYVAGPGGAWFVTRSEEEADTPHQRRVERHGGLPEPYVATVADEGETGRVV